MEILRQITSVKPDAKYRLRVEFDTGEEGLFDASPLLGYFCYRRLKDVNYLTLRGLSVGRWFGRMTRTLHQKCFGRRA